MLSFLIFIGAVGLIIQALIGLSFLISSIWEKEPRASLFALIQFLGMFGLLIVYLILVRIGFFHTGAGLAVLIAAYLFAGLGAILMLKKTGANPRALKGTEGLIVGEVKRHDEREIIFARNRSLKPGTEQYEIFYREHPEYEAYDTARREKGGPIGHPGSIDRPYSYANVAMMIASGEVPIYLSDPAMINPERHFRLREKLKDKRVDIVPEEATERIKGYAKHLGAGLVGITEINPLWVYSHRGEIFRENWEDWGKEIELEHKYAIVFGEEMDLDLIRPAPHTPTCIESMQNYAKGAYITVQIASFIANLGYSATANHFRHYDLLLVPMAVDAGLGELSRMGYLITEELGPRLRLSAVTTDLPLIPDKPVDIGVEDFCRFCKKCAVCCPSQSISIDDFKEVNGSLRWKLNEQTCFEYWGKIGTDCNICMRVCPWSYARTFPHKLIVAMITRNMRSRRIFSIMDDIFYGKKPKPGAAPNWAQFRPLSA